MSASNPSGGRIAAENELLARLGLPPSASPEDVDQLHLAVSQFLAAAPSSIKGWARAQAASLDEAYLTLTDPVGLEGSALRSPTRPPTVVPGGPATPPARRGPVPTVAAAPEAVEPDEDEAPFEDEAPVEAEADEAVAAAVADDTDTDDLDALYASVTPGAHRDMTSGGKTAKAYPAAAAAAVAAPAPKSRDARRQAPPARQAAPVAAPSGSTGGVWKVLAIITTLGMAAVIGFFVIVPFIGNLGNNGAVAGVSSSPAPSAGVDMAQVQALMQKITADPKDLASLQQLGDLYYQAADFASAATFYDKLLAVDPKNVKGLLARGAVFYNTGDMVSAKKAWEQVVAIDPKNVEAHYDLGFLAMNQASPDWNAVKREWQLVIALDRARRREHGAEAPRRARGRLDDPRRLGRSRGVRLRSAVGRGAVRIGRPERLGGRGLARQQHAQRGGAEPRLHGDDPDGPGRHRLHDPLRQQGLRPAA
ncbi:MAG: hypothetical protein U0838_09685 [Chloroflexota bacterium]